MILKKRVQLNAPNPDILTKICAITPIDGRYANATNELRAFCSEGALQNFRTMVEILWLLFLQDNGLIKSPQLPDAIIAGLKNLYLNFSLDDALNIKKLEKKLNHDVKAVEIHIANWLNLRDLNHLTPYVHILLTSEDVTNAAYAFQTDLVCNRIFYHLNEVVSVLEKFAKNLIWMMGKKW